MCECEPHAQAHTHRTHTFVHVHTHTAAFYWNSWTSHIPAQKANSCRVCCITFRGVNTTVTISPSLPSANTHSDVQRHARLQTQTHFNYLQSMVEPGPRQNSPHTLTTVKQNHYQIKFLSSAMQQKYNSTLIHACCFCSNPQERAMRVVAPTARNTLNLFCLDFMPLHLKLDEKNQDLPVQWP